MDKVTIKLLGLKLRQYYVVRDELPFPIQKALETLGQVNLVEPEPSQDKCEALKKHRSCN